MQRTFFKAHATNQNTTIYEGTAKPYLLQEEGATLSGFTRPLAVTPAWVEQSYRDALSSEGYDPAQQDAGAWASFTTRPWPHATSNASASASTNPATTTNAAAATDSAVQQLVQAMSSFAPAAAGQVRESAAGMFAAMQMLGVDGGN